MLESSLEKRLVKGLSDAGALAMKFTSPGRAGVPDRIVLLPGGRVIFVELKTEKGHLTELQISTHNTLRSFGFDVRTLYGKQYVEGFIHEIRSLGLPTARRRVDPVTPQLRTFLGDGPR